MCDLFRLTRTGEAFCVVRGNSHGIVIERFSEFFCQTCDNISCYHISIINELVAGNNLAEINAPPELFESVDRQKGYVPKKERKAVSLISSETIPFDLDQRQQDILVQSSNEKVNMMKFAPDCSGNCPSCKSNWSVETVPAYNDPIPLIDRTRVYFVEGIT